MTATTAGEIVEHVLDGPHGDLRVRVYGVPGRVTPVAGLVWAHGGAFFRGDLDMPEADWLARRLADAGVVVVSVDYALVPERDIRAGGDAPTTSDGVRFPVPSEELAFAFAWAAGADLGVEDGGWSLGGASAGGNLAAGAALRLRDAAAGDDGAAPPPPPRPRDASSLRSGSSRGPGEAGTARHRPTPRSVVLAYPVAHYELPTPWPELAAKVAALPSDRDFPFATVRAMNDNYLGHRRGAESPYAFPGGADLRGLPPTMIVNSDHDALRSSGEAYAAELAAAGTDVYLVREDGTFHGHLNQPDTPGAARSIARITAWLSVDALVGTTHEPPAP